MPEKRCFKCGGIKPLEDFYKHSQMADGHLNKCKECTKIDVSNHRHGKGREYVLEYDRIRAKQPHRVEQRNILVKRWMDKYPDRKRAQVALGNAVRDGRVERLPCFCCGEKAEAHHPDYSDPLYPIWLCPAHHKQAHALGRKLITQADQNTNRP